MKVTVRDCLDLSVFKDAQVVAGTSGLGNDVRAVSVLEATVPNEIKAYADDNGGMLLTGFFAVRDDAVKQEEETVTVQIPVGTPVTTRLGTETTFSRLAVGDNIKMLVQEEDGEQVILEVWIVD